MYLQLNHQKLKIYSISQQLIKEAYRVTKLFPAEEKFALSQQLRRAAVSSFLNLVEGSSRISTIERKRFYEIARSSVVEIDAALEIAHMQGYISSTDADSLGATLIESFKYFSALINSITIKKNN